MELAETSINGNPFPTGHAESLHDHNHGEALERTPEAIATNDESTPPAVTELATDLTDIVPVIIPARFPNNLPRQLNLIRAQNGKAHSVRHDKRNPYVLAVGTRPLNNIIRDAAQNEGITLRQAAITEVNHILQAKVDMTGVAADVWYRVAPVAGGIEIDSGDDDHTRYRITAGQVEIIGEGSETLFCRTPLMQPMARPGPVGDIRLLKKYVNLDFQSFFLFTAWLSYTLANPKLPTSKYVILVLQGGQGSGKSAISKLLIQLLDPSFTGVRVLPREPKDLAIATQAAHVLCYDNLRSLSHAMADTLCISSTGGSLASRQLYTDADQQVISLHGAVVLNGIHNLLDQSDLAQRCLPLTLSALPEGQRRSEAQMKLEFEAELPTIQRGLFDLIANTLQHLPNAKVTDPTRMIEFSQWLAGMEMAQGDPPGTYQGLFNLVVKESQLDAILDNVLAADVFGFAQAQQGASWSGTPSELLGLLNFQAAPGTQRSREWPQNVIALSKRLVPLQAGLLTQGISLELSRGKHRTITIKTATTKPVATAPQINVSESSLEE